MISTQRGIELPMKVSNICGSVNSSPISPRSTANSRFASRSLSTSTPSQSKITSAGRALVPAGPLPGTDVSLRKRYRAQALPEVEYVAARRFRRLEASPCFGNLCGHGARPGATGHFANRDAGIGGERIARVLAEERMCFGEALARESIELH